MKKKGKEEKNVDEFVVWNMQVPKEMDEAVKKVIDVDFHVTRAEFVRDAVRKKLEEYGIKVIIVKDEEIEED